MLDSDLNSYDYALPKERIAQYPLEQRDQCQLLYLDRFSHQAPFPPAHDTFDHIDRWLRPGDLVVLNDTRVLKSRLSAHDESGRKFEVLLLSPQPDSALAWECLVKPAKKLRAGKGTLYFPNPLGSAVTGEFQAEGDFLWKVQLQGLEEHQLFSWMEATGKLPLPPYVDRAADSHDDEAYQTVFAKEKGSVAAPTAGLHFSRTLIESLTAKGISFAPLTLHVGYGTFSPIRTDNLELHRMHPERYTVSPELWERIQRTRAEGGRVIACGTTVVRALESVPRFGLSASTELFIRPGFEFQVVQGLVTNFHLPKSSLLVLVSALVGRERLLETYGWAISQGWRFFSYGDAMLIL